MDAAAVVLCLRYRRNCLRNGVPNVWGRNALILRAKDARSQMGGVIQRAVHSGCTVKNENRTGLPRIPFFLFFLLLFPSFFSPPPVPERRTCRLRHNARRATLSSSRSKHKALWWSTADT